jgi:hypothetical protein
LFRDEIIALNIDQETDAFLRAELMKATPSGRRFVIEKFISAALGSVPWVGGFLSAVGAFKTEEGGRRATALHTQWLEEHTRKQADLRLTLETVVNRFDDLGAAIDERIQSQEYLALVRRGFRLWGEASTNEKRGYVANVLVNAAGTRVCSDDVIRLFLDWLNLYHESHFAVIRQIYSKPQITRYELWDQVYGDLPLEDSAEADLFKLLIRDLSTGGVIRQERETNEYGRYEAVCADGIRGAICALHDERRCDQNRSPEFSIADILRESETLRRSNSSGERSAGDSRHQ